MGYLHRSDVRYLEIECLESNVAKERYKLYSVCYFRHSLVSVSIDHAIKSFMKPVMFSQYLSKKLKLKGVFMPDLLSN
jgi:hypothetical protein